MQSGGTFRLTVRRGPQPNQVYELTQDTATIGRDITNEITINDPEVSRHHCRLTRGGGGYTIEDLGSTNGTFVNGQRLTGARPLTSGDMVGMGETVSLVYEAASMSDPADANSGATMPGAAASGQQSQQPASYQQQQDDSYYSRPQGQQGQQGQQAAGYASSSSPPTPAYSYQEDVIPEASNSRWVLLGCGCFLVLCIIFSIIAIIIIDQTCAWDDIPLLSGLIDAFGFSVDEAACS